MHTRIISYILLSTRMQKFKIVLTYHISVGSDTSDINTALICLFNTRIYSPELSKIYSREMCIVIITITLQALKHIQKCILIIEWGFVGLHFKIRFLIFYFSYMSQELMK